MKEHPFRLVVAVLLVASAALFFAGSRIERHSAVAPPTSSTTAAKTLSPTEQPSAEPRRSAVPAPTSDGGEGTAAHEAAEHAAKSTSLPVSTTAARPQPTAIAGAEGSVEREAAERAGEASSKERIFGIDVEQPGIVAAGAAIMLVLAAAAIGWRQRFVLLAIALVAVTFAAFDVREAIFQHGEGHPSLVVISSVLGSLHIAAAILAVVSARSSAQRPASTA